MTGNPATLPLDGVRDLMTVGAPLPFRVLDGQGRLLLAQGQCVLDARQIMALLERGACVEYDEVQALRQARQQSHGADTGQSLSNRRLTWFDRWERHVWDIDEALRQVGREAAAMPLLEPLVQQQVALVSSQPDAALFTLVRQDDRRFALYAQHHARYAGLVVQLTATILGWSVERMHRAVAVALTMNTSIVELQARMAEQAEPPSKKQMAQIRAHPGRSAEMLRASGVTDADWLSAVEDHHEQPGACGYPRAIAEPDELVRLVRAADVYTAKVSPRAFRAALPTLVAVRQLFQQDPASSIAGALIKAVGLYPPGELVRLKNGEAGIVVRRATASAGIEVAVLLSASGRPVSGGPRRDTAAAGLGIAGPLTDRSGLPRILPEQVFGLLYL